MKMKKDKGFTLIEILIVISLMGLLSFIVLASLDKAREMGRDSQMQSQFASLRAQAEKFYNKYNTFGTLPPPNFGWGLCSKKGDGFGGAEGPGLLKDIANTANASGIETGNETAGALDKVTCHATNDKWVVEAPTSTNASVLCVDSTGITTQKFTVLRGDFNNIIGFSCLGREDNYIP